MKLKDFFKPTFRIMPVYKDYKLTGWTVSVKYLLSWFVYSPEKKLSSVNSGIDVSSLSYEDISVRLKKSENTIM